LGKIESELGFIEIGNKSLSKIICELDSEIRDAIGYLSIYRQQYNLDIEEFEVIECNLHTALNLIETIR
jgi:hypothetical protein